MGKKIRTSVLAGMIFCIILSAGCTPEKSSYIGTKAPSAKKCPGDIVFSDGSCTPYSSELSLTDEQKQSVVAVVFYRGRACSNDGKKRTLAVGLHHYPNRCAWSLSKAEASKLQVSPIVCTPVRNGKTVTFEGDVDGSDNFFQIASFLTETEACADDTQTRSLYPAFSFALSYGSGTCFEDGWYLPSVCELYQLFQNKAVVEAASVLCGGDCFQDKWFWSSSQCGSSRLYAYDLNFLAGDWNENSKFYEEYVCVIREL